MENTPKNRPFYTADDVIEILDVKRTKAYEIIRRLNAELEGQGFMTTKGKVSKRYFHQRFFGYETN